MSRSQKKGPYIDDRVMKKVMAARATGQKTPIKTWSRACQIAPEFVGCTFLVHNGRTHIQVFVSEEMVGHRLGEFAPTRTKVKHGAAGIGATKSSASQSVK